MSIDEAVNSGAAEKELAALVATLHATGQRLEELTGGEVDAVVGRDGTTFLLQSAQDGLRLHEAARQAAILNALPAHIALVDNRGDIVSVNRTWREFADANALLAPRHTVGTNYIEVSENAREVGLADGGMAADGIRSVLAGTSNHFSLEYPCHSPTQQRWFLMTVTPLSETSASGAVIMHLNITAERTAKNDLLASELQFRQMAESVGDVFTLRELESHRTIYVNPAYETIWGRSCASLYADPDSWLDAVHPDDRGALIWQDSHGAMLPRFELEFRIVRPDGSVRWIEARRYPVQSDAGSIARVANVAKDITDRKQAEIGFQRLNRVYSVLGAINALIVRACDRDELFQEACRIAVEQGGFQIALLGIMDHNAAKIVPVAMAGKSEELVAAIKGILAKSAGAPTAMVVQAIAERKPVVSNDSQNDPKVAFGETHAAFGVRSMAILPLIVADEAVGVLALYAGESEFFHAEEMRLLTGLADDIALAIEHIERQERLDHLAMYDPLTGLANRRLFLERLAQRMRGAADNGNRIALFLIDLERFKNINDSLGQPAGDTLLKQVAEWLTQQVGEVDRVARVGADQFAIVSPEETHEGDAARRLEVMIETLLAHRFGLNGDIYRIAAKFGVAMYPDDGIDAHILFKNAEAALKKAKSGGHRYLFYTQEMTRTVAQRLILENRLRQALDRKEFVLHYQPKVNLGNGEITGVEALIRWNDPCTGVVLPGMFIPILEDTGMIFDVGRWALHQALEDFLRWRAEGLHAVRIAVNVSPLQLRHPGFIAVIEQAMAIDAHAAEGLELEITEGMIMADMQQAIASLHAIRVLGIRIAIDDFGTGFSSLGYLSKLPIDTLKIDRMFVAGMADDAQGLSLVSTIINLAHSLRLNIVAEGVETSEQSHLLRLLKCDEMQGYLLSEPVPAHVLEEKFLTQISKNRLVVR